MFIKAQQHPDIELNVDDGQLEPMLVHHLSNRGDPFKSVLPLLAEGLDEERVLVLESPLAELLDWTIQLHAHPDFPGRVVVDQKYLPFFEAVKNALSQAAARLEQIEYAALDGKEDDD